MDSLRLNRATLVVVGLLACAGCGRRSQPSASSQGESSAPAGAPTSGVLQQVTLQLNWFPEVEHGGYYAALVHGFYREAGLDVKILPGGPDTPVLQQVARRAATFGIVNADNILFARAQQAPVVAIAAPLQTSPRCLIVHEGDGIEGFDDLKDMTIAMSNSAAFAQFLRFKVPLPGVKIVPYSGNVAQFLLNNRYAQQGYVFSEPFVARKEGGDPKVLKLSGLGFNPYTSCLFTCEAQLAEAPEVARKMVAASIRGWEKYITAPQETNRHIHQVNPEMDMDILAFGAETIVPLVRNVTTADQRLGAMTTERWQTLADQLIESDQLKQGAVDVKQAFSTEFLAK